jgi:hypothetical protein
MNLWVQIDYSVHTQKEEVNTMKKVSLKSQSFNYIRISVENKYDT